MIHHAFEQGSPEWLAVRRGCITGSRFKDARDKLAKGGPSNAQLAYAMDTARELCGGTVPPKFQNAAMRTGQVEEPEARIEYEAITGNLVQEVGFITTDDGIFGLSPDGLIGTDGVLEIKTMVSSDTLFTAVADGDISAYADQCNGYLWLLGRQWVDLVLWAPDMKDMGLAMTIHRIHRDEAAIEALESDLVKFAALVKDYEQSLRNAAKRATE